MCWIVFQIQYLSCKEGGVHTHPLNDKSLNASHASRESDQWSWENHNVIKLKQILRLILWCRWFVLNGVSFCNIKWNVSSLKLIINLDFCDKKKIFKRFAGGHLYYLSFWAKLLLLLLFVKKTTKRVKRIENSGWNLKILRFFSFNFVSPHFPHLHSYIIVYYIDYIFLMQNTIMDKTHESFIYLHLIKIWIWFT